MRLSPAALFVLAAACGSPSVPCGPEVICGSDAAISDARSDARVVMDTGMPDASGPDAQAPDAARAVDAGYSGECWLVPQTGCDPGEACRGDYTAGLLTTQCEPAGTLGWGECFRDYDEFGNYECVSCRNPDRSDACAAGLFCRIEQCLPYCASDADCAPYMGRETWCRPDHEGALFGWCTTGTRP